MQGDFFATFSKGAKGGTSDRTSLRILDILKRFTE
jgi:hypothetical protein